MFKFNPLYLTDGYKIGHKKMLASGTSRLYGTWIPRKIKYMHPNIKKIVSFGQQLVWRWLHDQFQEHFFLKQWSELKDFVADMTDYLGLPYDGNHFKELYDIGYLPIRVKALPEGVETPAGVPHMTFVNTVDGFGWLTLYLETIVSAAAWKPSTSATTALQFRRNTEHWVNKTDPDNAFLIPFMCHDFSARGLSPWDMITSGLGHATSFRGSDTLPVIPAAREYYKETDVAINSVNASEHSVSTTKIFTVGEKNMIGDWLRDFPTGIISMVADTFDLWDFIEDYMFNNKEAILARDGKLVVRPDSGDPVKILCGYTIRKVSVEEFERFFSGRFAKLPIGVFINDQNFVITDGDRYNWVGKVRFVQSGLYQPEGFKSLRHIEAIGVIEALWNLFGGTVNDQGFKVLDPHVGAIYGDAINLDRQVEIYQQLATKGFAATNVVLGVGSFTYQYNSRDSLGWAAKGGWFETKAYGCHLDGTVIECERDAEVAPLYRCEAGKAVKRTSYNIYKDPITSSKWSKKSPKGLLRVNEDFTVTEQCTWKQEDEGLLQTIYLDGIFHNQTSLTEVRERINSVV